MFEKVNEFNEEVIGIVRTPGAIADPEELKFMRGTIIEELNELDEAHAEGDFVKTLDAVADIIYFATGFFTRLGIPPKTAKRICYAVHDANMTKNGGRKEERIDSHDLDAVKPEGWVGPEQRIMEILDEDLG